MNTNYGQLNYNNQLINNQFIWCNNIFLSALSSLFWFLPYGELNSGSSAKLDTKISLQPWVNFYWWNYFNLMLGGSVVMWCCLPWPGSFHSVETRRILSIVQDFMFSIWLIWRMSPGLDAWLISRVTLTLLPAVASPCCPYSIYTCNRSLMVWMCCLM